MVTHGGTTIIRLFANLLLLGHLSRHSSRNPISRACIQLDRHACGVAAKKDSPHDRTHGETPSMGLGFGIIGCGSCEVFTPGRSPEKVQGAKLVACFDSFPAAADRLAAETGCRASITISTSCGRSGDRRRHDRHPQRRPHGAGRCGSTGQQHVVVQKPLEITWRPGQNHRRLPEGQRQICRPFFLSPFTIRVREIRAPVDEGRFGRLTMGDAYVKLVPPAIVLRHRGWRGRRGSSMAAEP